MNRGRFYLNGELREQDISFFAVSRHNGSAPIPSHTTFISHQQADSAKAVEVARLLSRNNHPCYVDVFDPDVDGNDPKLESHIRNTIGSCGKLMAVVSPATRSSWWVPLEIGVALEKEKHLATYLLTLESLPNYLWLWPMLRSDRDILQWAKDTQSQSAGGLLSKWRTRSMESKRSYAPQQPPTTPHFVV